MESKQQTGEDFMTPPPEPTDPRLFFDIDQLMIHSLKAVQGVINNDRSYMFLWSTNSLTGIASNAMDMTSSSIQGSDLGF